MATLRQYAQMCEGAYHAPGNWKVTGFEKGGARVDSTGFKGMIYVSATEVVVAYAGTETSAGVAELLRDVSADLRLMVDMPRQMDGARQLFEEGEKLMGPACGPKKAITICGHSLGGALSQFMGYWRKANFVTFNAPGVYSGIQGTKAAILHSPQKALRTWAAAFSGHADGRNYRMPSDLISRAGIHYGQKITFEGVGSMGLLEAHSMKSVEEYLASNGLGGTSPFEY